MFLIQTFLFGQRAKAWGAAQRTLRELGMSRKKGSGEGRVQLAAGFTGAGFRVQDSQGQGLQVQELQGLQVQDSQGQDLWVQPIVLEVGVVCQGCDSGGPGWAGTPHNLTIPQFLSSTMAEFHKCRIPQFYNFTVP